MSLFVKYTQVSDAYIDELLRTSRAEKGRFYLSSSGEMFIGTPNKRIRVTDTAKDSLYFLASGDAITVQQAIDNLTAQIPTFNFITSVVNTVDIDLSVSSETLSALLTATGVAAGMYGDATNVAQVTIDSKGRISLATNVPIAFPADFISSVSNTSTVNLTVAAGNLTADVRHQMSIVSDASGIKLSGDVPAPGNNFFYGTDGAGVKGWHAITPFITAIADTSTVDLDVTASTLTANVIDNTSRQKLRFMKNSALIGTRWEENYIDGQNISISVVDAGGSDRVDTTISITGIIPVANGGTGLGTFGGINTVLYTTAANVLAWSSNMTFDGTRLRVATTVPEPIYAYTTGNRGFAAEVGVDDDNSYSVVNLYRSRFSGTNPGADFGASLAFRLEGATALSFAEAGSI